MSQSKPSVVIVANPSLSGSSPIGVTLDFHDLEELAQDTYVGYSSSSEWLIKKMTTSGKNLTIVYAKVENNPTHTSYADAWINRLSLVYNILEEI